MGNQTAAGSARPKPRPPDIATERLRIHAKSRLMSWEWLTIPLLLAWFNDWPWLWALVGLQWFLGIHHWPSSPWPMVIELAAVLSLEAMLAILRPRRRLQPITRGAALEGAALGGFALLWSTLPGLLLWHASLGSDAAFRVRKMALLAGKRAILRAIRVAFGIVLIILYHAGVWA